jgi:hypothetical protein
MIYRFVSFFGSKKNKAKENMPSSVVSVISYNTDTSTLRIIFVSGRVYDYKDVPERVFNAMKTSFSKGIYFNRHIKDNYQFEKIK